MIARLYRHLTIKTVRIIHVETCLFSPLMLLLSDQLSLHHRHYQEYQCDLKEGLGSTGHLDDLRSMLVDNNHMPRRYFE